MAAAYRLQMGVNKFTTFSYQVLSGNHHHQIAYTEELLQQPNVSTTTSLGPVSPDAEEYTVVYLLYPREMRASGRRSMP